jgi:hypothetical protein
VQRRTVYKTLCIAAALLGIYAAAGYLLVPYLVERSLPGYAQENLGAQAAIGKVRFDPFLLKVEAHDFQLSTQASQPVLAFQRLLVDLDLATITNWAWTFGNIVLDGLHVNAEIDKNGRLNLAELADHWSSRQPPKQPDQKPPRAIVRQLKLNNATAAFTDFSSAQPAKTQSDAINLEIADLSTLPDREGQYVLTAKLPSGGELSWRGELTLQPIASDGEWRLEGFSLATVWQFLREEVRIAEPQGSLDLSGRYAFRYENETTALSVEDMNARVKGLSIARRDQRPDQRTTLSLQTIEASKVRYDLAKRELVVPRLGLSDGSLAAAAGRDGKIDWEEVFARAEPSKQTQPSGASTPFHARVESIAIERVNLRYIDDTRAKSLEYGAELNAEFDLNVEAGDAAARLSIERLQAGLTGVRVKPAGVEQPLAELKSVNLEGVRLDTAARTIALAKVTLDGATTAITHLGDGRITLVDAFAPAQTKGSPSAKPTPASESWSFALESAELSNVRVALSDQTYKPPLTYDLDVAGSLKKLTSDPKVPAEFDAKIRVAQGGNIQASGTLAQDFTQASAKVNVSALAATPLRPVLSQYTTLDLKSGSASMAARVEYRAKGKPATRVQASAKIADLLLNEAPSGDRFLSWKSLDAADIALTLSPNRLTIKDVRIEAPGAKIAISKDRSVNLTRVMKRGDATADTQAKEEENERFPVRVARIAMRQGTVDFADESLVLPFSTRVGALNGAIVGLSTSPRSRAELKLEGEIDPTGAASAEGALRPADPKSFMDITVKFDNVAMPPLSPYTATFAGRKIAAGRLWVEVQYKIADSQLLGENKIMMSDFQLGERVEAPNALDLPLDLAVALLKEPDGRIRLAVPVRGDLDSPKFEYGALIRDAIGNVLRRIVTAPFRFIAGLFGGGAGDEDLQSVVFDPGSARIPPAEREQLQKVSEALKGRQQLKLVIHGAYDPQRDGRALRERLLRRDLAAELGIKLQADEDPGPAALDSPATQRALEKMMTARAGSEAVDRFAAEHAKKTGKEVNRVNPLLATFRRGRGDRDFYEALFDQLVQSQPLPDKLLPELAEQRARSIAEFMAKTGIDAGRVAVGKTQTADEGSKAPATRLSLEAA